MSFHKILCPVDFSGPAAGAVRYADDLAAHFHAELTLLHVARPVEFEYAATKPTPKRAAQLTARRNRELQHALDLFPGEPTLPSQANRELAEGEPAETIVKFAREGKYDLVILPTHGAGLVRRWLLIGSVTSKILHTLDCPVIAAVDFEQRHSPLRVNRVLCAIDLGPQSSRVLCYGAGLAREFGASLSVIHAAPGIGDAAEDFLDESWRLTLNSRLAERIAELQRQAGIEGEVLIEAGDPHKVVMHVANRSNPDLVVIGRGASGGLLGRLRAHAYEIIRHSPCPVLSV